LIDLATIRAFVYSSALVSFSRFDDCGSLETSMALNFLSPFRYLYKLFTKDDSPKQLAFGVALGVTIGLIPKGNLIAALLTVLLFAFRTNLGAGLLTIFGVSAIAARLDPLLHGIGARVLGHPAVYYRISKWYELPLMPWTSLNNTVVVGGVLLSAALFYPAYHLSEMLFDRYYADTKSMIARRFKRKRDVATSPASQPPQSVRTAPTEVVVDWRQG
jgi:uncharacterized protein (TIGR03546 family)